MSTLALAVLARTKPGRPLRSAGTVRALIGAREERSFAAITIERSASGSGAVSARYFDDRGEALTDTWHASLADAVVFVNADFAIALKRWTFAPGVGAELED